MKQDKINRLLQQLLVEESFVQEGLQSQLDWSLKRAESYTETLKSLSDTIVPEEVESAIKTVTELPEGCPYKEDDLQLITEENVFNEVDIDIGDQVYISELSEPDSRMSNYKGKTLEVSDVDTKDSISPFVLDGWWCDINKGAKIYKVLKPKGDK